MQPGPDKTVGRENAKIGSHIDDPRSLLHTVPAQHLVSDLEKILGSSMWLPILAFRAHTVYQAQAAFQQAGLSGLLPKHRGPKEGHKLSAEVIDYVVALRTAEPGLNDSRLCPGRSGKVRYHGSPPQSGAGVGEQKKTAQIRRKSTHSGGNRRSLRKDSADKQSNRTDEEDTWKAAGFSYAVGWQFGLRAGLRPCRHVHPNRIFHLGPKRQSSTPLG